MRKTFLERIRFLFKRRDVRCGPACLMYESEENDHCAYCMVDEDGTYSGLRLPPKPSFWRTLKWVILGQ